jgi:hypothetical protein
VRDALSILVALGLGLFLARYDLNTDDTGIEVGLLLIASVLLALLAPKRWWVIALGVGLPIPIVELVVGHAAVPPAGIVAFGVAVVGALIGWGIRRTATAAP